MTTAIKADASGAVTLSAELCRAAGLAPGADLVAEVQSGRIVVQSALPNLIERILARAHAVPPEELAKLPADGAAQVDHYLYGHPNKPG